MDRRFFLLGAGGLALSQLLVGCGNSSQLKLNVRLLSGSIPSQVVNKFRKSLQQPAELNFTPVGEIQALFDKLSGWQLKTPKTEQKPGIKFIPWGSSPEDTKSDLVSLGDYWLKWAIEKQIIQPLGENEVKELKYWGNLDKRWQELVKRNDQGNLDPEGRIWAAPYRWGSTVIVYNREKLQEKPEDWGDLWRDELRSRISLIDQPREVIGLVLKSLGKSYNTENLDNIPELKPQLKLLNKQVKFYSSTNYLEPLIIGDTLLAVGWSSDIMPILPRYPQLNVVVPKSGSAMWADVWVRPAGVAQGSLSSQWIDFCWQANTAEQIARLSKTNSPVLTKGTTFDESEFLLALAPSVESRYQSLFAEMKLGG